MPLSTEQMAAYQRRRRSLLAAHKAGDHARDVLAVDYAACPGCKADATRPAGSGERAREADRERPKAKSPRRSSPPRAVGTAAVPTAVETAPREPLEGGSSATQDMQQREARTTLRDQQRARDEILHRAFPGSYRDPRN
jgi:hypothetical protein